ncbi:SGNH/GDSL hydrolase family protein [Streptomyces sp. RFCAC02]|uniref:SGNH/GDSL hydrolase family protein n=1 Tax=Streptomyces sp. RFCAC02 TaxID=2499143 RepID=UPI0010229960|nr:SGNH/GDSL hydrolase family protein [Streptomyces sp. RFCAC02]
MKVRWGFALLAGLLAVLLGVVVSVGTGREERRDLAAPEPETQAPAQSDAERAPDGAWVGTWSAAPTGAEPGTRDGLPGQALRNVVHTSVAGSSVRIELSNAYGSAPVTFTEVTVALGAGSGAAARPGSLVPVTFGGGTSVTIPVGETVVSDAMGLEVPADADLLVTVYAPEASGTVTYHRMAQQTSYAATGAVAADETGTPYTDTTTYWRYLTGVQVHTPYADGAVVVLGDSLTDGITSTPGANHRWTDFLADRLRDEPGAPHMAVLNQGISGNRLLRDATPERYYYGPSALARLDTDVLDEAGVRTLFVQIGINDLILQPHQTDPAAVVAGLEQLVARAHEAGLRVVGTTLTPFGVSGDDGVELERVRQQVNAAIRAGGVFDAVADFDKALRDPMRPQHLLAAYDSGDGLHPSDAGYAAMAGAVDPAELAAPEPDRSL